MKLFKSILVAATLLLATPAYAASTAAEVIPGYLTTSGCVPSTNTPCFLQFSLSNPLPVVGGGGGGTFVVSGSTSNASSGVATSSTNLSNVAYLYGFNGTTWDQLQVDGSKNLKVLLAAGSAVIGHVIVDTAPSTAVTNAGTFAVQAAPTASATGGYSYLHIAAGQATTTVKSGAGTLHAIILNSAAVATDVTTIYDNTAASGTVIGIPNTVITTFVGPVTIIYDVAFTTGLTINTATANGSDMTIIYK